MYEQQRKKGRPLTGTERSLIEHLYKLGLTQTAIAKEVGVWPSTILFASQRRPCAAGA